MIALHHCGDNGLESGDARLIARTLLCNRNSGARGEAVSARNPRPVCADKK
jgi:hypothetical protein